MRLIIPIALTCLVTAPITAVRRDAPGALQPASNMKVARASHSATLLNDGSVLIAGGFAGSGSEYSPFQSTEIFRPGTGEFVAGASMHVGRSGHTATRLTDGRVLLAGGWTGRFNANHTAEIYDPVAQRFSGLIDMHGPRAGQTATLLADGKVLLAGGVDNDERPLTGAEIFDPATGRFAITGAMHFARVGHTATRLADGTVLIVGGGSGHYPSQVMQGVSERYDPRSGTFRLAGVLHHPRHKHAAVLLADGDVLVIGGSDNRDWRGEMASAELYRTATDRVDTIAPLHSPRFKLPDAATLLATGDALVAGGSPVVEVFDQHTYRFSPVRGELPRARFFSSATRLLDGRVLITGGYEEIGRSLPASAQSFVYRP